MDSNACNYSIENTHDDGSCWTPTEGCSCDDSQGAIIDECGVCGGDGVDATTACCSNTGAGPNGEVADCAGVCGGNSILSGCDNVCNSTAVVDCSGECGGDAVEDCTGLCGGSTSGCSVYDVDGNGYTTVTIGTQEWLVQNLKVTKYNNGDDIPTGYSNSEWNLLSSAAYAVYPEDEEDLYKIQYTICWFGHLDKTIE